MVKSPSGLNSYLSAALGSAPGEATLTNQKMASRNSKMRNPILFLLLVLYIVEIEATFVSKRLSNIRNETNHEEQEETFRPITTAKPQTRGQKLILDVGSRIRNSSSGESPTSKPSAHSKMISSTAHETSSPSTMSSFYKLMNKKSILQPKDNQPEQNVAQSQNRISKQQRFLEPQANQMYSQQLGISGLRDGAAASMNAAHATEFNTPLIFASGNTLQVHNPMSDAQGHLYAPAAMAAAAAAAAAASSSTPIGQEQIENSFYINNMGAQPMSREPSIPQELSSNEMAMRNHQLAALQQNPYIAQQQQQMVNSMLLHGGSNYYNPGQAQPVGQYGDDGASRATKSGSRQSKQRKSKLQKDREKKKKKDMLTPEQLATLIEELKEFNSRQQAGGPEGDGDNERLFTQVVKSINKSKPDKSNGDSKDDDDEADDDRDQPSSKSNESPDERSKKREDDDDDDGVNSEDLAKFAKMLVSKKSRPPTQNRQGSAPMRYKDEDEDMKDALLESGKRPVRAGGWKQQQQHRKPKKDLVSHIKDKQQSEVDSGIDNFIREIANRSKKLDRKKPTERQKEGDDGGDTKKEGGGGEEESGYTKSKAARKRRDHQIGAPINVNRKEESEVNDHNGVKFNKSMIPNLIRAEKLSDKSDGQDAARPVVAKQQTGPPTANRHQDGFRPMQSAPSSPPSPLRLPAQSQRSIRLNDTNSVVNGDQAGEEKMKYPKSERNKDHETLKRALLKARASKSELSERIPIPMKKVVKKALNGELAKLSEANEEMKLQPNGDGGTTVTIKHDNNDEAADQQPGDSDEDAPTRAGLVPARVEPEKSEQNQEYPISEQVTERLNKLSNNLDRYFNDGFLQEVEKKSQPNSGGDGEDKKQSAESYQRPQTAVATNTKTMAKSDGVVKKDNDFDIDVAIDGKRDIPDPDEDDSEMTDKQGEESVKKSIHGGNRVKGRNSNRKRNRRSKNDSSKFNTKQPPPFQHIKPKKLKDPVENESLDTPIGPDEDDFSKLDFSKTSLEPEEKQATTQGRKTAHKLYHEPD